MSSMTGPYSGHINDYKCNMQRAKMLGLVVSYHEAQYSAMTMKFTMRLRVHHRGDELLNVTLVGWDEDELWSTFNGRFTKMMDDFESWK